MSLEELEAKIKALESKVEKLQRLQDIEDIRKLQYAYGYFLINWLHRDVIDCFSRSDEVKLEWPQGTFIGSDASDRFFGNINTKNDPEFIHQMMQISGYITVEDGGDRARGRWWGFGAMAIPAGSMEVPGGEGVDQSLGCGIYEMGYIKENGVWKILSIKWVPVLGGSLEEGWVKPERRAPKGDPEGTLNDHGFPAEWHPDTGPDPINYNYPTGRILPFHFRHPVTGNPTTEDERNK